MPGPCPSRTRTPVRPTFSAPTTSDPMSSPTITAMEAHCAEAAEQSAEVIAASRRCRQVTLFADAVGLDQPGGELIVYLLGRIQPERVQDISR